MDYTFNGRELIAEMDTDKAIDVHQEVDRPAAPGRPDVVDDLRLPQLPPAISATARP